MMRKFFIAVLSVILTSALTLGASCALIGDTDLNGKITASDARAVLRYSAKLSTLTKDQLRVSDLNSDSKVTAADARIILRISAKLDNIDNYIKEPTTTVDNETTSSETSTSKEILSANKIYSSARAYTLTLKSVSRENKTVATGTGFYINDKGWIATNYHVIKDAYSVTATDCDMNDHSVTRVISYSKEKDLAIVSIEKSVNKYASFSDSYSTGDAVYTLGSPLGLELTFTSGMISQANRRFYELNDGISYIQITAPITVGNSGSPLINEYGDVIGVCSMTYQSAQNMNFAIPISELKSLNTSNPITLPAFYRRVHSDSVSDDFAGILLPASDSVTVSKGGTYALYVIGIANGDYSIDYSVSNGDFSVIRGGTYGNVTMLYITSDKTQASATLELSFDRLPSKTKTVSLCSTPSTGSPVYSGIKGNVPDFGAICALSPFSVSDSTANEKNTYEFRYDLQLISDSGLSEDKAVTLYTQTLMNNGFSVSESDDKNCKYTFENALTKTNVYISKKTANSKTYISISIKY